MMDKSQTVLVDMAFFIIDFLTKRKLMRKIMRRTELSIAYYNFVIYVHPTAFCHTAELDWMLK